MGKDKKGTGAADPVAAITEMNDIKDGKSKIKNAEISELNVRIYGFMAVARTKALTT